MRVQAYGLTLREEVISTDIVKYLKKLKPDIVVITGHDFFIKIEKILEILTIIKIVSILQKPLNKLENMRNLMINYL